MFKIKKLYFLNIFLIILLAFCSISVNADDSKLEISLNKAFEIASKNNIEIIEARKTYKDSKNEINKFNENSKWKLSLSNNFAYSKGSEYEILSAKLNPQGKIKDNGFKDNLSLSLNRSYHSGLRLSSNIKIIETEPLDFNDLENKYSYNLNISLPLYPKIPTENEMKLIRLKDNFEIAKFNLNKIISEKEISWLKDYLYILQLKENITLIKEKEKVLLNELNRAKKEYNLGERGKYDLLNAKISLEDTKINLSNLERQLRQEKKYLYNSLGLEEKYKINFTKNDQFLKNIKAEVEKYILDNDFEKIHSKIEKNNTELKSLKKELIRKKDNFEALKKNRSLEIRTNTNYTNNSLSQDENLEIAIELSWDIFDNTRKNIELDNLKREISYLKDKIDFEKKNIELELNSLLAKNDIYKMKKQNNLMKVESTKLKMENMKRKNKENIITRAEYLEYKFKYKESLNEKNKIENEILINNLEILNFFLELSL